MKRENTSEDRHSANTKDPLGNLNGTNAVVGGVVNQCRLAHWHSHWHVDT